MATKETSQKIFIEIAPAKINLYLHVLNIRDDGYHNLDSLITFADFGDQIILEPADKLSFKITGEFAKELSQEENSFDRNSKNIIAKTLWSLADFASKEPLFSIILTKNIPLGAGLGGGSADAAALARILCSIWGINSNNAAFQKILFSLGADIPACFKSKPCRIIGSGEQILSSPNIPKCYAVLVHPNKHCSTAEIFKNNKEFSKDLVSIPKQLSNQQELFSFLKTTKNDLTIAAQTQIHDIKEMIKALKQNSANISRMSGSGSACFGLFDTHEDAQNTAQAIKNLHPNWWIQAVTIS